MHCLNDVQQLLKPCSELALTCILGDLIKADSSKHTSSHLALECISTCVLSGHFWLDFISPLYMQINVELTSFQSAKTKYSCPAWVKFSKPVLPRNCIAHYWNWPVTSTPTCYYKSYNLCRWICTRATQSFPSKRFILPCTAGRQPYAKWMSNNILKYELVYLKLWYSFKRVI